VLWIGSLWVDCDSFCSAKNCLSLLSASKLISLSKDDCFDDFPFPFPSPFPFPFAWPFLLANGSVSSHFEINCSNFLVSNSNLSFNCLFSADEKFSQGWERLFWDAGTTQDRRNSN
jgi:hypothetical protein